MHVGMIGLGRMGSNMARRLMRAGHSLVGFDHSADAVAALAKDGAAGVASLPALVQALPTPRVLCLMIPTAYVDATIDALAPLLERGDIVIDGGNSFYQDSMARSARLSERGVAFIDMGTSGGVWGLERGYCLMIGGDADVVRQLDPVFAALAPAATGAAGGTAARGYLHCGPSGAGHFVKMVHNGIEYGLMAAYAEGLNILQHANAGKTRGPADAETAPIRQPEHYQFDLDVPAITEVWRHGSVIQSWLLDLTAEEFARDPSLQKFEGRVSDSGEGRWTLQAANDEGVPAPVLAAALFQRFSSRGADEFAGKVLSAMRLGFGGHEEKK
jgi:6-phosphogluconate dehydrogenase